MLCQNQLIIAIIEQNRRKTRRALIKLHGYDLLSFIEPNALWLSAEYFEHHGIACVLRLRESVELSVSARLFADLILSCFHEFPEPLYKCSIHRFDHEDDIHIFGGSKLESAC